MVRDSAIERRAVRELQRTLAGVYAPFALQKHGTDFTLRALSGSCRALRVELKATETPIGNAWSWTACGTARNGKPHSLWSQCRAAGSGVLLLAFKRGSGRRRFFVVGLAAARRAAVRALQKQCLQRTMASLTRLFGEPIGAEELAVRLAAL